MTFRAPNLGDTIDGANAMLGVSPRVLTIEEIKIYDSLIAEIEGLEAIIKAQRCRIADLTDHRDALQEAASRHYLAAQDARMRLGAMTLEGEMREALRTASSTALIYQNNPNTRPINITLPLWFFRALDRLGATLRKDA